MSQPCPTIHQEILKNTTLVQFQHHDQHDHIPIKKKKKAQHVHTVVNKNGMDQPILEPLEALTQPLAHSFISTTKVTNNKQP